MKIVNRSFRKGETKIVNKEIESSDILTHCDKAMFIMMAYSGLNAIPVAKPGGPDHRGSVSTHATKKESDNANMNLAFSHRVEMLKNLKNLVLINKENLFSKITELLFYRQIKDDG